jgi:hypothetical protein
MTDPDWARMSVDDKLDWLKTAVDDLVETENRNISTRRSQMERIMSRLAALEEAKPAVPPPATPQKPPSRR